MAVEEQTRVPVSLRWDPNSSRSAWGREEWAAVEYVDNRVSISINESIAKDHWFSCRNSGADVLVNCAGLIRVHTHSSKICNPESEGSLPVQSPCIESELHADFAAVFPRHYHSYNPKLCSQPVIPKLGRLLFEKHFQGSAFSETDQSSKASTGRTVWPAIAAAEKIASRVVAANDV